MGLHAAPLSHERRSASKADLLALNTSMDHSVGEEGGTGYAEEFRASVPEALSRFDFRPGDSEPDRAWYEAMYEAGADVEGG